MMDIEKIVEEVRAALLQLEPTGGVCDIEFFNTKEGGAYVAELHMVGGKFAFMHVYSREEYDRRRAPSRHFDQDETDFHSMIGTLSRDISPEQAAFYATLAQKR